MFLFLIGVNPDGNIHKKENWITGNNINPGKGNKYESEHMVFYDELEPADWEEIVNLIKKRNEEKNKLFEQRWAEIQKNSDRECKVSNKDFLVVGGGQVEKTTGSAGDNSVSKANRNENELVAVAVKTETKPSVTENKQLTQILHAIQNLEQRITELEKAGHNPQQVQTLKQQVKNLETQKAQLTNDKQIKEPDISTKTNETNNNQIANNSAQPNNTALLIVGGLLIVGVALVIGYLLGKDKKANQ